MWGSNLSELLITALTACLTLLYRRTMINNTKPLRTHGHASRKTDRFTPLCAQTKHRQATDLRMFRWTGKPIWTAEALEPLECNKRF